MIRPGRAAARLCACFRACVLAASLGAAWGPGSTGVAYAQPATAIEYRHSGWNHYFITAIPAEITALDGGGFGPQWSRTGYSFAVDTEPGAGRSAVCRFFTGASFAPRSSHFYTPIASECADLQLGTVWQYEGNVFQLTAPDAAGHCPAGTRALHRLYNQAQGGAPNHRYTTSKLVFDQMVAAGWAPEGIGPDTVFSCVPEATVGATAEGRWLGTSSRGDTVRGYVLDSGEYVIFSTPPGGSVHNWVLQGTSTAADGQFTSADARDFPFATPGAVRIVTLSGSYVARSTLTLTVGGPAASQRTLVLAYDPGYESPATVAAAAGVYSGVSGHAPGNVTVNFTVLSSGTLGGANANCSFGGSVAARGAANVFDLTVIGNTQGCIFGQGYPIPGIVDYDPSSKRFVGFATFGLRSDAYNLVGTRP
jgi:hypothetical protein